MANKLRSIFMLSLMPLFTVGVLLFLLVLYLPSQAASGLFTVNSTADTDDGSCNVADCTLREAINAANNTPDGDIIVFSLPPSSTITLNGNQLPTITGTLKIDGSTVVNLTISGDNQSRVFVIGQLPPPYPRPGEIIDSSAVTLTYPRSGEITGSSAVTLTHLTVVNGNDDYGGGISNGGNLTIINSHFTNNHGIYGTIYNNAFLAITNTVFNSNVASVGGGAIFNNFNGDLSVSTTQFIENAAADAWSHGGSIYNKGGTVTIIDSDFISNTATPAEGAGYGGAIFNSNSGNLLVENSDFHQNSADSGGALWNNSSADVIVSSSIFKLNSTEFSAGGAIANIGILTVTNSAIISNSAASGFGGIYNSSNPLYLSNSTIIGNIGGGISAGFGTLRSVNNTIYSNVGVGLFF